MAKYNFRPRCQFIIGENRNYLLGTVKIKNTAKKTNIMNFATTNGKY